MFRTIISPPAFRIQLDSTYRITAPRAARVTDHPEPLCSDPECSELSRPGCGGKCARCWAERRAIAALY